MRLASTEINAQFKAFEIYLSGCMPPRCKGCHNPELWDFRVGEKVTTDNTEDLVIKLKVNPLIERIWILGGEPLDQNPIDLISFVQKLRKGTGHEMWLWTGKEKIPQFCFRLFDYIKYGPYKEDYPPYAERYFGIVLASNNQEIIKKGVDY